MNVDAQNLSWAPKRVLMSTDAVGGVWQYSVHLAHCLIQRGSEVLLVSLGPRPSEEQKQQVRSIPGLRVIETGFALEWMPHPWEDIDRSGEWLLSLENEFRPDVIHLNGYCYGALPWQAPTLVVAHSCVYSWWKAVHNEGPGPEWHEYKARVTFGLQKCCAIVVPSAFMADAIASEYEIARDKIEVIHNAPRLTGMRKAAKQPFALAAGRFWDPAKNLELLAGIAPRLQWQLRIAGTANQETPESRDSAGCYLGALPYEAVLKQFQRATLFLHPALYEPFGLAVLEAACAGCCLVLSDIASLRELWRDAAVFIDPRDPEQWVFEVNKIIRDFELRESLARAASLRSRHYQPHNMLQRYLKIYEALHEGIRSGANGVAA